MPTFDGGHCFLTALLPISTGGLVDQTDRTGKIESHNSHVHLVREILSILPTANQSPFTPKEINSPFARNNKTHFVRMAIIDDVTFNGRVNTNRLSKLLTIDPMVAQPVDSLNCPYLMFVVDFDAPRGDDVELDGYLRELWTQIGADLAPIFMHCHGFAPNTDEHAFAAFVKERMIETTMPFNDY